MFIIKVYIPVTRVWVARIMSGVPFGAQMAWLSSNKTGMPFDKIRVAPVTQLAVTHGLGAPETLNGHPATTYGAGCITMG